MDFQDGRLLAKPITCDGRTCLLLLHPGPHLSPSPSSTADLIPIPEPFFPPVFTQGCSYFDFRGAGEGDRLRGRGTPPIQARNRSAASRMHLTGNRTRNPGMRPDWELNMHLSVYGWMLQPTEPQQPGRCNLISHWTALLRTY